MRISFAGPTLVLCTFSIAFITNSALSQTQKPATKTASPYRMVVVISDVNCTLQLDGEGSWVVVANRPRKIGIGPGQHILSCITDSGYVDHEAVEASSKSPYQTIVQMQMAQQVAQSEADKADAKRQADADAAQKKKEDDEAKAESEAEDRLLDNAHSHLRGSFICPSTPEVKAMNGMGTWVAGVSPTQVPVLTEKVTNVYFSNGSNESLSGTIVRNTRTRLISYTDAQSRGYSGYFNFSINPSCFATANGCQEWAETSWKYVIVDESVADNGKDIRVELSAGTCSGACPSDPFSAAGKKDTIKFNSDDPGFSLNGLYCRKN